MPDYPCWFSNKDLYIAQTLVEKSGFTYIGKKEDFIFYDETPGAGYQLAKIHDWQLFSAYGERGLEAIRDGAIFFLDLEEFSNIDAEKEVKNVLRVVKVSLKKWKESPPFYKQLSLEISL